MRLRDLTLMLQLLLPGPAVAQAPPPHLTVGLFIASIEEGGRIFTPVRFLPFEHPEALGHQFPTVLQLHAGELELLLHLGRASGYRLDATLQRYPTSPDSTWPYTGFTPVPPDSIRNATATHLAASVAPIPGLRAVAVLDGRPVGFLVDTRGLSLAARHMEHATTMGLDLTRQQFLDGLNEAATLAPSRGATFLVFDP